MGKWLFAALFLVGGVGHFAAPEVYLRIMPPYLPAPRTLIAVSGAAELILGSLLLVRSTQPWAAWGLIALLIAVFPANVFMWQHADRFAIPPLALLIRLPLQGALIAWAWSYTRSRRPAPREARSSLAGTGIAIAVLVSAVPGCGFGTPSLPRLDRGALVRAESVDGKPVIVYFAASEETVAPGTVVKVVSDEEGTTKQVDRKVIVGFQGGPHEGLAALIRRRDLQPDR